MAGEPKGANAPNCHSDRPLMPTDKLLAIGGGAVAIIGVPAYMGWANHSVGAFILYALVAGAALAAADRMAVTDYRGESAEALVQHAIFRAVSVAVIGGFTYAVARLAF